MTKATKQRDNNDIKKLCEGEQNEALSGDLTIKLVTKEQDVKKSSSEPTKDSE